MLLKLTAPNGTVVELESTAITSRYGNDGTYHPNAKTILMLSNGSHQAVVQTLDEIKRMESGENS